MYQSSFKLNNKAYHFASIKSFEEQKGVSCQKLPFSLKILLENQLRFLDNDTVSEDHLQAMVDWLKTQNSKQEIAYRPARVLMQDFTGVPAVVDLAAMRDAVSKLGGDPKQINPLNPVDLVIDHSVQVDKFASLDAFKANVDLEMERNSERYEFLKWGQSAFDNFRVVPPGTGICHQVNVEYLGQCVWKNTNQNGETVIYPDTLVGTDSHTTMINGLGILGWGVGGIEAEAAMLGQPISMLIPEVIGFKLDGSLPEGITATDLVLTITEMLRAKGVVGKFVEFYGPGLDHLPLADRATIANMAPEYGATCGFFPIDQITLDYLKLTAREEDTIALVETYCKEQGLWRESGTADPTFTDTMELNLSDVVPSLAGPKRPQDRVSLSDMRSALEKILVDSSSKDKTYEVKGESYQLSHGDAVIAAITSCTNTSNPSVLMAAGLVAKKAIEKGLQVKPWVKTSLAPGSKVVTEYLERSGLQQYLDKLGFNLVGYGCTTCIGNSGPLPEAIASCIQENQLVVSSVLSGNRNFEGRVHPHVKANWLASPPLVVAFALAGTTRINLQEEPIGQDSNGEDVFLKDVWPSNAEIANAVSKITREMFKHQYADVFSGDDSWQAIQTTESNTYAWKDDSTYIQNPPFFEGISTEVSAIEDIVEASILAKLGDSITTDHISPAGAIKADSPAGEYLKSKGIQQRDFNSYGSRRGNHEVMMRGTFANIRIKNEMLDNVEGGFTRHIPSGKQMSIYDAAMRYQEDNTPLVVIAGKEYGTGSSRDWAAKGTRLLGVKAVIAESFERIHRSNLIGMGVLPLQFQGNDHRQSLKLTGDEKISISDLTQMKPGSSISCAIQYPNGETKSINLLCRIDTENELTYYRNGGILHYVIRKLLHNS